MEISGPRVDMESLEFEQGWAMHEGNLFTGVAFESWPDGKLRLEVPYLDGYRHGTEREWYPSGQLKMQREIAHGAVQGAAREWAEDGRLLVEATYDHGKLIERKRHDQTT